MVDAATVPSWAALVRASEENQRAEHENFGFLSVSHGLMPSAEPELHLPPSHRTWDDLAAELPELYGRLAVRRAIEALPVLPAGPDALAERYLLRAAALLGVLAHAYWWADRDPPLRLPAGVAVPWRTVSHRLGRPAPHLSYVDLVVYNWRLVDRAKSSTRTVENMRLLLPTVDNEAEHVFYLTQAEILARCAPVVDAVVRAQAAARADEPESLITALGTIAAAMNEVVRLSLPKISPAARSRTHVDPVLWAKTVAPFGVPISRSVPGPSGTSSPIFHVLDAFFGRSSYRTRIGREMTHLGEWHPHHWREFVAAVRRTSVRRYVEARADAPLRSAWDEATDRYATFLDRHRLKVYGYLELAFKVGRTVTIGGFAGPFRDRTWDEVDTELSSAAAERPLRRAAALRPESVRPSAPDAVRAARSRLVRHNDDLHGYWIAVDDVVYDVGTLRREHPGGVPVLEAHAGTDATAVFHRIGHHRNRRVTALAHRYRIGVLDPEPRQSPLYRAWIRAAYLIAEMQNALRIDRTSPPVGQSTALARRCRAEVHGRFLSNCLDAVTGELTDVLWRRTVATCRAARDAEWMLSRMNRIRQSPDHAAVVSTAALGVLETPGALDTLSALERGDDALLAGVKEILRTGAERLEGGESDVDCGDELVTALRTFPGLVEEHCREARILLRMLA